MGVLWEPRTHLEMNHSLGDAAVVHEAAIAGGNSWVVARGHRLVVQGWFHSMRQHEHSHGPTSG